MPIDKLEAFWMEQVEKRNAEIAALKAQLEDWHKGTMAGRMAMLEAENTKLRVVLQVVIGHGTCYCGFCKAASREYWTPRVKE